MSDETKFWLFSLVLVLAFGWMLYLAWSAADCWWNKGGVWIESRMGYGCYQIEPIGDAK